MFILNLKLALRNLWNNKVLTAINIFGLSVGLSGFILILVYVNFESSYDTWNPVADQVYRISVIDEPGAEEYPTSPGELAPALKANHPEILSYARIYIWDLKQRLVGDPGNEHYVEHILGVDSSWFDLFPYKFIYGNAKTALASNDNIVLSSKTSKLFFGDANPVGKTIKIDQNKTYHVTGVYENPPSPEHMPNDGFVKAGSKGEGWGNGNFFSYLKLAEGTDLTQFRKKINQTAVKLPIADISNKKKIQLLVQPVKDIYLKASAVQDIANRGNAANHRLLLLVSGLLLFIACMNFTNLSIAQSSKRAKEIGVRKVMGARKRELIIQFLTETAVQCLLAMGLAWAIAEICLPLLNQMMGTTLVLYTPLLLKKLMLQIGIVMVIVTFIAGGYAAFFLSGFNPTRVLKGDFSRGQSSLWLRKVLIVSQFVIAAVFISVLFIINKQVDYMKNKDTGFNSDQVMVFKIRKDETRRNFEPLKERLLKIEGVAKVGRVNYYPGVQGLQVIGADYKDTHVNDLSVVTVDADYFDVMGMHAAEGELFSGRRLADSSAVVINEAARDKYGMKNMIGQQWIYGWHIAGVVKNHIQKGMETGVEPMAFAIETENSNSADHVVLKVKSGNFLQTIKEIESVWQTAEPFPFEYQWLDQSFQQVYIQYIHLSKLFNIFTYVALFVAVLGLFALASFVTKQRTKEIGIRKVLGADDFHIVKLINGNFLGLILIANIIAIPLAILLGTAWLKGFVYRTDIDMLPFLYTTLISLFISVLTVSAMAYKAAKTIVVKALKYE